MGDVSAGFLSAGFCPVCADVFVLVLAAVFIGFLTWSWYEEGRDDASEGSRPRLKGLLYVFGTYGWFVGVPVVAWLVWRLFFR